MRDHYKVYRAVGPDGPPVLLVDQFEVEQPDLQPVALFANPVRKNCPTCEVGIINHPDEHLTFYPLTGTFGPTPVSVDNQFGPQTLTVGNPLFLAVPSQKAVQPNPLPSPIAFTINHYKCYEAQGDPPGIVVTLDDQFGTELDITVGSPNLFCNPVSKNQEVIPDPLGHLTCYAIIDTVPPFDLSVRNQFGEFGVSTFDPVLLCVPSRKLAVNGCCGPVDRCIDTDGTATAGDGIPGAVDVAIGDPLASFPVALPNDSGLDMFDNDGDNAWTFGAAGDDLHAEGLAFCPTGIRDGLHQVGSDCVVLDLDGSFFDGQPVSCDLEVGAFCVPPLPTPITYHDTNGNGAWDDAEDIVLDVNQDGICN